MTHTRKNRSQNLTRTERRPRFAFVCVRVRRVRQSLHVCTFVFAYVHVRITVLTVTRRRQLVGTFFLASFGVEACGAYPRNLPREEPAKTNCTANVQIPSSLRRFWPCHTMIEIFDSHVVKDSSIMIWPGKNAEASWEFFFGFQIIAICGSFFFNGAVCRPCCGGQSCKLSPRKKNRQRNRDDVVYVRACIVQLLSKTVLSFAPTTNHRTGVFTTCQTTF